MSGLSSHFIGGGRLLVACAEFWRAQGHAVCGLITDCPEAAAWAQQNGVSRISPGEDQAKWLAREEFDYLFSVVNHALTPAEVLALPRRRAINYHDAPLPRYAGFNATAWAIIDGRSTHAVTWHEMSGEVDAGHILVQRPIEIRDDDTAFSLGVRCVDAALESFRRLVGLLEAEALHGAPLPAIVQGPQTDFHLRSDRPGPGLIDLSRPVAEIDALIRGLDLGSDDNWMCRPKLKLPGGGVAIVGEAAIVGAVTSAQPGTVLSIDGSGLTVVAGDGALRLSGFATVDGAPLGASALGMRAGEVAPAADPQADDAGRALDAALTKHERFWVARLANLRAPLLADLKPTGGAGEAALETRLLPKALRKATTEQRRSALTAALAAYLARVGEDQVFDLALRKETPSQLAGIYADRTPLRAKVDLDQGFDALRARVERELEVQARRGAYARDAVTRYAILRAAPAKMNDLALGLRFSGLAEAPAMPDGERLTLIVPEEGDHYAWAVDRRALPEAAFLALADRFDILLANGLANPAAPLAELDILPAAERGLLLGAWQDTQRPYAAESCVHDLFEAQAARTPEATAAVFEGVALTYRELDARANAMAHELRNRGVGPEVLVGVCVERSLEMIVALMGVLKAGGAYVPLDPVYPRERLGMMLEDSKAKVLVTQRHLVQRLPDHDAEVFCVEDLEGRGAAEGPKSGATPENLAYVIFTSGSTGRPKGVMVKHGNVSNFFTGMDEAIGAEPGVWLAVTSISFDISVLELFWTLTRGFEVVIQGESDRASLAQEVPAAKASGAPMAFSLFYFSADQAGASAGGAYRLMLEGAKFADAHEFSAVWTPERHFHAFGGLYPNPAVTTAALAAVTSRVALRAGSIVLPLHDPLRVAEDWSVIDQLSGGRVGLSFASGWHADDFAFMPQNYERRREVMLEHIETVLKLWRGEAVERENGKGAPISVKVLPRPVQAAPPMWIASAGSVETFQLAGRLGANVLTNMLGQDIDDLRVKFAAYQEARAAAGHEGPGVITVMLHTFVCEDTERARELARKPFCDYLASSFDLIKVAPTMFPAFKSPSRDGHALDAAAFSEEDMAALLDYAFDRYFETAGLFGAPERALEMVERLKAIGANEVACLIDFGIDPEMVLDSLPHLDRLRQLANPAVQGAQSEDVPGFSIPEQIAARGVTHLQCTPSMARMLASDDAGLASLAGLKRLLLGGEALPADLAETLAPVVGGEVRNMYGPTETTIWSTSSPVRAGEPITIGRPIANTVIRILDPRNQVAPVGVAGELCIGGAGVVRGYLGRPDLTAERFALDPCEDGAIIYRTGDLARYRGDGEIEFLGRLDHQVKVNGYRIELGEIETVLGRHPAVRQNVVVARTDDGPAKLVAYVIPSGQGGGEDADRVAQWQGLWDEAYKQAAQGLDARFNIAGWNDSYAGAPIPAAEMAEWLDGVEASILAFKPRKVLEIGCGTGMVLYRVMPHVDHYSAVDLSPHALETIRAELTPEESAKVTLLQQPAHALAGMAERSCDTVVINSVVQYFPDAGYLAQVLQRASELVADGGRIFIGDVRSRDHLDAFQTAVALRQSPNDMEAAEVSRRIEERIAREGELVLSEAFFHALARETPRIAGVDVRLKREAAHNEMSLYRYDVVLHVGAAPPTMEAALPSALSADSLAGVSAMLADAPPLLVLEGLKNARLSAVYAAREALSAPGATAAHALQVLAGPGEGIDPAALFDLHPDYMAEVFWARSGDPARFDAVLRHRVKGPKGRLPVSPPPCEETPGVYANQPVKSLSDHGVLFDELRAHLREVLPEYMTPSAFVVMDAFPLTPNGKIDRKALPAHTREAPRTTADYAPPTNALEETIAAIWKGLLNLERVGLKDNIFDLGANSLLTAQANQRLSAQLGRKISLVSMFRYPTIGALAAHLDGDKSPPLQPPPARSLERPKWDAVARRRQLRAAMGAR